MSVISYSGKFGKDGQIVNETTVTLECPSCHRIRSISVAGYKVSSDVCHLCSKGLPLSSDEAIGQHPNIVKILTFGVRGDVVTGSKVLVVCAGCDRELVARYDHVTEVDEWKCASCAYNESENHKTVHIFVSDLPDYVVGCEKDTLSPNGEVITSTIIYTQCPLCPRIVRKTWAATKIDDRGNRPCQNCAHGLPWKNPEYKKRMTERAIINGNLSKLHQAVKEAIGTSGITGFESERFIGGFARVDELNVALRVVLEVYGDWWHFNPSKYDASTTAFRNGKTVTAGDVWKSNQERIAKLVKLGYSVYIMWESDFRTDPTRAVEDFKEWLVSLPVNQMADKEQ
jgi:G:T-mismatch repair DNA endonuclease (very short patch repair protein)